MRSRRPAAEPEGSLQATWRNGCSRRKTYIYCNNPEPTAFTPFYEMRKNKPDWTVHTIPCTHFVQMDMPDELTTLLLQATP